ncbi:hypothetical protein [Phycicoccus sp.]|uniref:hypothetical protein n=1 Tax=Phycicoccus sp. TaxID=1902410 RepID=UPI002C02DF77|nr:hypothetical protein [Phycicoccus sp.]HMM95399.1 hypothetical protein [Phycicoccus sp.]
MSYDEVFPLPDPDFLWVHSLVYLPQTSASVVTDDATGRWQYAAPASVAFDGYITSPGRRDIERGNARGISVDAVVLIPHSVPIPPDEAEHATLVCGPDSAASPWLWGEYEISEVRPNPSHIRAIMSRIVGEKPPHGT